MGPWLEPSGARGAFERLGVHEGSHMGPSWTKRSPSRTKMDPSWGHVRPRWAQHDPRWAPSWAKMVPSWSNMGPRWSKLGQDEPMMVQVRSKRCPFRVRCRLYWFLHGLRSVPPGAQMRDVFPCWERVQGCIYIRSRDTRLCTKFLRLATDP